LKADDSKLAMFPRAPRIIFCKRRIKMIKTS